MVKSSVAALNLIEPLKIIYLPRLDGRPCCPCTPYLISGPRRRSPRIMGLKRRWQGCNFISRRSRILVYIRGIESHGQQISTVYQVRVCEIVELHVLLQACIQSLRKTSNLLLHERTITSDYISSAASYCCAQHCLGKEDFELLNGFDKKDTSSWVRFPECRKATHKRVETFQWC